MKDPSQCRHHASVLSGTQRAASRAILFRADSSLLAGFLALGESGSELCAVPLRTSFSLVSHTHRQHRLKTDALDRKPLKKVAFLEVWPPGKLEQ